MHLDENDIRKYCTSKPHVVLTVATHEKGVDDVRSFGSDGVPIAPENRSYEVGSISKVLLSTLLAQCLEEDLLRLDDTTDRHIDLPSGCSYPTILQLATHTSGYADPDLFDSKLDALSYVFSSGKKQDNPFDSFSSDWLIDAVIEASRKPRKEGRFQYSNFGYSVLGHALGQAMDKRYFDCIATYIKEDLGLLATSCNSRDLCMVHSNCIKYLAWPEDGIALSIIKSK